MMSTARDETKWDNQKEEEDISNELRRDEVEYEGINGENRANMAPPVVAAAAPAALASENDWAQSRWSIHKSLADALSSSLANIANQEAALKFPPPSATSSSSNSSGNENANNHNNCTVVTVTTSGDDNPSSDDHKRRQQQIQQQQNNNNHHHRSHSHHRRDDPNAIQSDELGLPQPINDRVCQRNCPHALVMARLPPPSYKYTSSSWKDTKEQPDEPSDGGYAASASSNDNCSSPSVSSSEEDPSKKSKTNTAFSLYSSSVDCNAGFQTTSSGSTSSYASSDEEQRMNHHNNNDHQNNKRKGRHTQQQKNAKRCKSWQKETRDQLEKEFQDAVSRACNRSSSNNNWSTVDTTPSLILNLSVDTMGNILSYIDPREVYSLLTMPVSKSWRQAFTIPQDLWKVLCISEPFNARVTSVDQSNCAGGRYRLLYTSFIRCMKYLARIKDDALNGRPPTGLEQSYHHFHDNESLKDFFAKARELRRQNNDDDDDTEPSEMTPDKTSSDDDSEKKKKVAKKKKLRRLKRTKLGNSQLTRNLLGPANGVPGHVNLPWSCAIYSIVNWMHAFQDVEGIQIMCLRVLPFLLEDETQRTTAQRAGLTDIVLRSMVIFPNSIELHTASFHTIVLLARPLGGREGMLFHSAMVNASGIFNIGSNTGKNGIAVMIDSMRRFANDEVLQAMSCWSMVNIALIPSQKIILVKMGGISVAADAMMRHPYNAEVQFRALFALINLVIPSDNEDDNSPQVKAMNEQLGGLVDDLTEREILDENVNQITNLVVVAMKNFCSSEAILNRACLVLHNLSLNERYHTALLWTPNCYQMLEWCIGNYRHDQVLQHSAGGTLQRLQLTLATDSDIRVRFTETIRAQQQNSLTRDSYNLQNININNESLQQEQQNTTS